MLKPLVTTLGAGLGSAAIRFPVPVLCAFAFCITSIWFPTFGFLDREQDKGTILAIIFCSTFWFISTTLLAESRGWGKACLYALGFAGAGAMGVYLWSVPKIDIPFALLGAGCFLSMFIAPFLRSGVSAEAIWVFNYRIWVRIALSVLAGLVLFLGLAALSQSFKFLFGIEQPYDIVGDIWLFVATVFSPLFAMAGIPRDFDADNVEYPKPIRLIVSFILLPLLLVYAVVLYLYTGKIAATWTLPEGGVVYLVSGFGIVGTIAWLASVPLHAESGFVATFARNFYRILLLPLVLLLVAIGIRIKEYGVTEERYVVVLCLIWLVLSSAFAVKASRRHAPRFIYLSLISLLFLASVGPWSATSFSSYSQLSRLEAVMERAGLLVDGKLVKLEKPPESEDAIELSDLIDYFISVNRLDEAAQLFGIEPESKYHLESNHYERAQNLLKSVGVSYVEKWHRDRLGEGVRTVWYRNENSIPNQFYDVRGFDYLIANGHHYPQQDADKTYMLSDNLALTARMDWSTMVLTFSDTARGLEVKFDLAPSIHAYIKTQTKIERQTQVSGGLTVVLNVLDFNAEAAVEPAAGVTLNSIGYELYVKEKSP